MDITDRIFVTGATGHVGQALIQELGRMGLKIRAGIHNEEKANLVEVGNVEPVVIDFEKKETLFPALEGVKKLALITPFGPNMVNQVKNVLEAAVRSGVKYIARLSVMRAELTPGVALTKAHGRCEDLIEGSGIDFTHIRPNSFMQNMLRNARDIKELGRFYGVFGNAQISYIDVRDIAAVFTRVLTEGGHSGDAYVLTGPQALSSYDIASILSEQTGKKITFNDISEEEAKQAMRDAGQHEWLVSTYIEWNKLQSQGYTKEVTRTVEDILNREPIYYEQFVKDHIQAFRPEYIESVR